MAVATSILVAHSSGDEREAFSAALYDAGFDVITAHNGEEALRSSAGVNPRVVIVHTKLRRVPGTEVYLRLKATGLELPPFVILYDNGDDLSGVGETESSVFFVPTEGLTAEQLVQHVRLLLLAQDTKGEFSGGASVMHGDLTRTSFGDLLRALQKHVVTGRLGLTSAGDACVWLRDGEIVDAAWAGCRGTKAFCRLAGLVSGAFTVSLEEPAPDRLIDTDLETLMLEAVEERLAFEDHLSELPSMDARPRVKLTKDIFTMEFSPAERQTISAAQSAPTLRELIDSVPTTDFEVARSVSSLRDQGILTLSEPADRVHLITDSTCDLIPMEARRLGITVLPVSIVFGSDVFKDGVDLKPDDFVRRLQTTDVLPTTSPVTKGEFLEAYRQLITTGDILSIHCSSSLSKSLENAVEAAVEGAAEFRELREEANISAEPSVTTLDSKQASIPLGLLVLFASRMLRQGLTAHEVGVRIDSIASRMSTLLMVRSLAYLERTGELKKQETESTATRPVLEVKNGDLKVIEEVPAGPEAHLRLVDLFSESIDPERPIFMALVHASAPAQAGDLRVLLPQRFDVVELVEAQMGPAVTTHNGPGTVGGCVFQPTAEELDLLRPDGKPPV